VWLDPKLMLAATPVHMYSFSLFLFPKRDEFVVVWGLGGVICFFQYFPMADMGRRRDYP